jgi:hypothetical protein
VVSQKTAASYLLRKMQKCLLGQAASIVRKAMGKKKSKGNTPFDDDPLPLPSVVIEERLTLTCACGEHQKSDFREVAQDVFLCGWCLQTFSSDGKPVEIDLTEMADASGSGVIGGTENGKFRWGRFDA